MPLSAIGDVRDLIEIAISAAAVLGGVMAFASGRAAAESAIAGDPSEILADRINLGLADGFLASLPVAACVAIFLAVS
jgi:hypothetical protein